MFALRDDEQLQVNWQNRNIRRDMSINVRDVGMIKSWMVIGGVAFLVALAANFFTPSDRRWFKSLQRPRWLTFEVAIPLIWTVIFICGAWSAYIVWEKNPGNYRNMVADGFIPTFRNCYHRLHACNV